ncbi:hypothetical protein THAOC_21675 [Thalassiosira oceanica]|uniref:Uncharacterized protein n=1 Tax=Thalassiosira oceanica TaxID=159749 RepID=K0RYY8_THAOC|nr:hypothetical protein THAOC_21675 [Thalassiosira oceanica]|eukprot:EJK58220.1 hypothetical protein THAOC_21675 [Thalassiosira oceanica]
MRPQLHDGPPGPPRFPSEFDDSLSKRLENELERNRSDHAGDDASTPSMDVEEEDGTASSQGATQSIRSHIEAAVATAPVDFNVPVEGPSTLIFDAYRVEEAETPGGGTVYEAELAEPNVVLRFYQRKGFVPFMIAVSLLAVVITVVAGVLLSKNLGDRNTDGDPPPPGDSSAGQSALKSLASTSAPATINFDVPYPMPVGSIGIRPNLSVAPTNLPVIELTTSPAESLMYKATQSPTWEPSTPWPTWQPTLTPTTSLPTNPPFFQAPVVPSLGNGAQGVPTLATETKDDGEPEAFVDGEPEAFVDGHHQSCAVALVVQSDDCRLDIRVDNSCVPQD